MSEQTVADKLAPPSTSEGGARNRPRYFDGRIRQVVAVKIRRTGVGHVTYRLETLECGHLYVPGPLSHATNREFRVCFECPGGAS